MWNYLLFAVYLTRKDPFEYNAQEGYFDFFFLYFFFFFPLIIIIFNFNFFSFKIAYVAEQMKNQAINWFPINRALSLDEEEAGVEERLDKITKILDHIVQRLDDEDRRRIEEIEKNKKK